MKTLYLSCTLLIAAPLSAAPNGLETLESSVELLESDLFSIDLWSMRSTQTLGDWELETGFSFTDYEIDYRVTDFDFFGEDTIINEETYSIDLTASRAIQDNLSFDFGLSYRDGFSSYREVWLDTFFDQHYAPLEGVEGHELYENFDASAYGVFTGVRWEYLPANAIASVTLSRIQDNVSPGYEIDFDGIRRGELVLATTSISFVTENVLTERLRSRAALTITDTSAREIRYAGEIALNAAIGQNLIWRNRIGAATEDPQYDAHFFDTAFEYQATERTAVYLQGRHYEDSGEIENALLFTTAAPALDNDSVTLGLRYANENWTAKFAYTYSESDFAPTNLNVDFFQNLYVDDNWTNFQFAIGKTF
ncbi:hypothetical protein [Pelagicoccus mobilis]|uniref:DUF3570 domain-containing protein n=1 Tax=Pelagicoccus mobilis TaxID=415221 RepID=A0A934VT82_9BACT|nr:hypothetical protein [Pelagicoccus mobilis]MBK1879443.1 hypothetical protein [Pelagicoccus mobilis]